jgi:5'-phosphate synthase pdxT subunit
LVADGPGEPPGAPAAPPDAPLVGVLALQGGYAAHARVLSGLGAQVREVRVPGDLDGLDGLVIPGGESTTMTLGIRREGLAGPLREFAGAGRPVLGTCAGLIMLDREHLGVMDTRARATRSAARCGPSRPTSPSPTWTAAPSTRSSSAPRGSPSTARASRSSRRSTAIPSPPARASCSCLSFHPELGDDTRLHAAFVDRVRELRGRGR